MRNGTGLFCSPRCSRRLFPLHIRAAEVQHGQYKATLCWLYFKKLTRTLDTEREALPERKQFNPCSEGKHTAAAHTRTLQALKSAALGHPHLPRADLELTYCPLSLGFAPADHADPVPRAKWSENYFPASQWQPMLSEHRLQPRAATLEPPWKGRR